MKIVIWLVVSICSDILYRLGGIGKPFNTKYRDIGCSLVAIIYMLILGIKAPWWAYLCQFGLFWGFLSTYWSLDEQKWGFWAHGLGLSFAVLPVILFTRHWVGFGLRTIILTTLITIWSEFWGEVNVEEGGRGFFLTATLPLLLI